MIDEREAIYILKNTAWLGSNEDREQTEEAVRMAIEALEKQIPRKPFYRSDNETWYCSACRRAVSVVQNYCEYCGQRIDFEEVEG